MDKYGYGLMLDCAKFWANRLEPGEDGKLHINVVVGPNEYKKYVDDSAFTNYLVWWTLKKAIRPTQHLLCLLRRAVVVRCTGLWQAADAGRPA